MKTLNREEQMELHARLGGPIHEVFGENTAFICVIVDIESTMTTVLSDVRPMSLVSEVLTAAAKQTKAPAMITRRH